MAASSMPGYYRVKPEQAFTHRDGYAVYPYCSNSVPPPKPSMDAWFGAELGPKEAWGTSQRELDPNTLNPILMAAKRHLHRVPMTRTDKNWIEVDSARGDYYSDRYVQLSSNVAHKHPSPARPRERMGRMGGSWRHIREVLGYTGSQVCFVDGLVSLYDSEARSQSMQGGAAWRARMSGPTGYSSNLSGHELRGTLNKDNKDHSTGFSGRF